MGNWITGCGRWISRKRNVPHELKWEYTWDFRSLLRDLKIMVLMGPKTSQIYKISFINTVQRLDQPEPVWWCLLKETQTQRSHSIETTKQLWLTVHFLAGSFWYFWVSVSSLTKLKMKIQVDFKLMTLSKSVWWFHKTLKIEQLCDPATSLLGTFPKDCKSIYHRYAYASIFVAELFSS